MSSMIEIIAKIKSQIWKKSIALSKGYLVEGCVLLSTEIVERSLLDRMVWVTVWVTLAVVEIIHKMVTELIKDKALLL